jgi:hypothetical protein
VNSGVTALKGQVVGSNGTLVKTGSGQLNITYAGANSWKATVLQAGTLAMGTWNTTFGTATSDLTVTGNSTLKIFDNNSTREVPTLRNRITVNRSRTLTIVAGKRCAVQGAWLGEGTVKISFPYVRGDFSTNLSQFEGTLNPTSGQLRLVAATDMSKATLELGAGVYAVGVKAGSADEVTYTHNIGALSSTAADAQLARSTWNVGYLGTNTTFAGIINGSAILNKYGEGTLTLTGASAAPINIYEGIVQANRAGSATTTGTITVNDGAMLCGTGTVASVTVQRGGTLGAGKSTGSVVGTLTLTGTLTMSSGSTMHVRATGYQAKTDAFNVAGRITLNDPIFDIARTSGEWSTDVEYKLFTGEGTITLNGTPTFIPERPAEGLEWDYSRLASEGILMVKSVPTGISELNAEAGTDAIYTLDGRRLDMDWESLPRGLYIVGGRKVKK